MSSPRTNALLSVAARPALQPLPPAPANFDDYGADVFGTAAIRRFLPAPIAEALLATITARKPLDPAIAEDVAHGMLTWAMERGATHFTHWFQPLNGGTAEKHTAFLEPAGPAEAIARFSGKNLIVGEPDASSFPSGGLRTTFEARGYTAWDPTSPAFVKRHPAGATLCIPTAFCSYTGEALDKKAPLLRSVQALEKSVRRLMAAFGQSAPAAPFSVTLGAEQEYFIIDRGYHLARPDLVQTGRTLFGAPPAKLQQLEDHYFGAIKPRIAKFMAEVERDLWRLGIPATTRHNEAAPAQFELAPVFEDLNLAVDHNMLVMEVLRQCARRNGLHCLLHEKPFAGVNGSGKHNNWSVAFAGRNLLDPGSDPRQNAIFLTVLAAVVSAVDRHADLLRASVASLGNDSRLGGNEAPPAIMSVFLGDELMAVVEALCGPASTGPDGATCPECPAERAQPAKLGHTLRVGVDALPPLPRDTTDRNRTSPFAFTGNKFEFRAVGSSQSCATPCTVLNVIVAEAFDALSEAIEHFPAGDFNASLQALLRESFREHRRILFGGDNYSAEWRAEAARRGLPCAADTPEALLAYRNAANQALFERYGVLTPAEIASRYEVSIAEYNRRLGIEAHVALDMARTMIAPAVEGELGDLAAACAALPIGSGAGSHSLRVRREALGAGLDALVSAADALDAALSGTSGAEPPAVCRAMAALRAAVDHLETIADDARWPLPKYREMLSMY